MAKVMLVEDDNNLREIYEARLAAEGYEIVSAPDGEAALALAIKEKPDLIISDIMMPKVSGFDMLDILRSTTETKNAKIIMMTALNQAEDKARAEQLGADLYLVKSQVTLEDVVKAAQKLLGEQNPTSINGLPIEQPTTTPSPVTTSLTANVPPVPQPSVSPPAAAAPQVQQQSTTPQPTAPVTTAQSGTQIPVTSPQQQDRPESSAALNLAATAPSTAQEEAALQAQIEQFITQNPTVTTEPTPANVPTTTVAAAPTVNPVSTQYLAPQPAAATPASLPEDAPAGEQKIAKSADSDTTNTEPGIDASVSGRKKVIQPISDVLTKGPDLNALLQKEGNVPAGTNTSPANSVITPQGVTMPATVQDVIPPSTPPNTPPAAIQPQNTTAPTPTQQTQTPQPPATSV